MLNKTRPVWPYPAVAQYNGTGDSKVESSFTQSTPTSNLPTTLDWVGLAAYAPGNQMTCTGEGSNLVCTTPNGQTQAASDDGGGCTIGNGRFDPILLVLALLAAFGAWRRRRIAAACRGC